MATPNSSSAYDLLRRAIEQQRAQQQGDDWNSPSRVPDQTPDSDQGPQGLLGRLRALLAEQSQYQPVAGTDGSAPAQPLDPNFRQLSRVPSTMLPPMLNSLTPETGSLTPMSQGEYEANQAPQARDAAAPRLARGARDIDRSQTANAPAVTSDLVNGALRSFANGVPIVGAFNNRIEAALDASLAPALNPLFEPQDRLNEAAWGDRYGHALRVQNDLDAKFGKEQPVSNALAGGAGSMASFGALGKVPMGAKMLGLIDGPLAEMMLRGATTRAAIAGMDAAARGAPNAGHLLLQTALGAAGPVFSRASNAFRMLQNLHRIP